MMSTRTSRLKTVRLSDIRDNPHRQLGTYPIDRRKVEALRRSIDQVGFWEGVIVRSAPDGEGYQCAFGHHRLTAAREEYSAKGKALRAPLSQGHIPVIVRDLNDGEMLQFMGRENAEDQRGNFLVMLETWESALRHLSNENSSEPSAMAIAKFLGWTIVIPRARTKHGELQLTATGYACHAAQRLIDRKLINREDFKELTVGAARDLAQTLITELDAVKTHSDAAAKQEALVTAAKSVAYDIRVNARKRHGPALKNSIRAQAYKRKHIPDMPSALNTMSRQISGWHATLFGAKLTDICAVISEFFEEMSQDDIARCRYLRKDLADASQRCQDSIDRIDRALDVGASAQLAVQTVSSDHWLEGGQGNDITKEDPVP